MEQVTLDRKHKARTGSSPPPEKCHPTKAINTIREGGIAEPPSEVSQLTEKEAFLTLANEFDALET